MNEMEKQAKSPVIPAIQFSRNQRSWTRAKRTEPGALKDRRTRHGRLLSLALMGIIRNKVQVVGCKP